MEYCQVQNALDRCIDRFEQVCILKILFGGFMFFLYSTLMSLLNHNRYNVCAEKLHGKWNVLILVVIF